MSKRNVKSLSFRENLALTAELEKSEKKKKYIAVQFDIPANSNFVFLIKKMQ